MEILIIAGILYIVLFILFFWLVIFGFKKPKKPFTHKDIFSPNLECDLAKLTEKLNEMVKIARYEKRIKQLETENEALKVEAETYKSELRN
jgi:hypothetical protein